MAQKTDETASRANDQKGPMGGKDNQGGKASDGKLQDVAQGGKRRGPGHWEKAEDPSGD